MPVREGETLTIVTSAGGAGTGTTANGYVGFLEAIDIDYGTADATTTVRCDMVGGAADDTDRVLFTTAASQTDGIRMPRFATTKSTDGTASTFFDKLLLVGRKLLFTIAASGATKTIKIRLFFSDPADR